LLNAACGHQWIAIIGMYYSMSGAQNESSLDNCMSACIKTPDCVGVDWNSTAAGDSLATGRNTNSQRCSLLTISVFATRYTIDDDMSHYEVIRNSECKGKSLHHIAQII
jgi:hypothetical protein